jgi:hypothetical protein
MPLHLQRSFRFDQVGAVLREGRRAGAWPEWLPGERRLCAERDVPVAARPLLPRLVRGASLGPPPRS